MIGLNYLLMMLLKVLQIIL